MMAQEIGALAMMEKLTRLWLPAGTPRKNIQAGFDAEWHKRLYENMIARFLAEKSYPSKKSEAEQEAYLRRTYEFENDSFFCFYADRGNGTRFDFNERFNFWSFYSTKPFPTDEEEPGYKFYGYMGCLSFDDDYGLFIAGTANTPSTPYSNNERTQFAQRWLSFFRRNCWLSGSGIECSHEERLEWTQLFPRDAAPVLEWEFERDLFIRRERLELRAALPREIWPQAWLHEEHEEKAS